MIEKQCIMCGKTYTNDKNKPFCSSPCKTQYFMELHISDIKNCKRSGSIYVCETCGKEICDYQGKVFVPIDGKYFCSRGCRNQYRKANSKYSYTAKQICKVCGKEFYTKQYNIDNGNGIYCSIECNNVAQKEQFIKQCEICGNKFSVPKSRIDAKYCSQKCYQASLLDAKKLAICRHCKKEFTTLSFTGSAFCSNDCKIEYNKNKNLLNVNKRRRDPFLTKELSLKAFQRDDFTCQHCGKRSGKLNAHHIIPYSADKSLANELTNLITLCEYCHKKEHKRLRKLHNEQLDIFAVKIKQKKVTQ